MIRFLFAFVVVLGVGTITLFLWQKQVAQYNFSFEQKEDVVKSFQDVIEDFQENLAPFDEALKRLEAIDLGQMATSSPPTATTTQGPTTSTVAE